jgi:hypothetical protein
MNREFTVAVTTSWQNLGTLLRTDLDYASGRGKFDYFFAVNEGTGVVSIKGNGSSTSPQTDGGIKLSAADGQSPGFEWTRGFNADQTWIKTTVAGNVSISAIVAEKQ